MDNTLIPSVSEQKIDKDGNVNFTALAPEDAKKYEEISKEINPKDVNSILNYGSDVQNSMERYSNQFLASVRTHNAGEIGGLINDLLSECGTNLNCLHQGLHLFRIIGE